MRDIAHFLENLVNAENPLWVTIIIALFLLVLAFILSPTSSVKLIDIILLKRNRKQKKKFGEKYFLNHPIYDYFSYNLTRLRNLDFGSDGKSDAIKDMLYLKFTIYHTNFHR